MNLGQFITLEGLECSGKSTQLELLKKYYPNFVFTREPGGTKFSEEIRNIIFNYNDISVETECYLFATARAEHMNKVVIPNLQKGNNVICDRFIDSSLVYQGFIKGLGIDKVMEINKQAIKGFMPNKTFFIDISTEEMLKRMKNRTETNRFDLCDVSFHKKCREGFLKLAEKYPSRYYVINGEQSPEKIFTEIIKNI